MKIYDLLSDRNYDYSPGDVQVCPLCGWSVTFFEEFVFGKLKDSLILIHKECTEERNFDKHDAVIVLSEEEQQ